MTRRSLADMADSLDLLALGQKDWLSRFDRPKTNRPPEEIERKKEINASTVAAARTLRAFAPHETELREFLRSKRPQ